jgi:hypothetical protein
MVVLLLAACGSSLRSAADIRSCIQHRLPAGAVDRTFASTEEGVTSVNYFHSGSETDMSIFPSIKAAVEAEKAEARLGDAHDRRLKQVLYSGGGVIEQAIVACVG